MGNKTTFTCSLLFTALFGFSNVASAGAVIKDVMSFTEMEAHVKELGSPESTLVVMDNDDTLTTMSCPDRADLKNCQYLGGAAWFSWQEEQLQNLAQPRVANNFDDLLTVASTLFAINNMPYTAPDVPIVLNNLTQQKVRLLVETARGNGDAAATVRQFETLQVKHSNDSTLQALISNHSLTFNGNPGKASPYTMECNGKTTSPLTYQQGAMYLSGQSKGPILKCMLEEHNKYGDGKDIKNVVFIDDTPSNVTSVFNTFKDSDDFTVVALNYKALDEHKKAFTEGEMAAKYQNMAMERWEAISEILQLSLQNPTTP